MIHELEVIERLPKDAPNILKESVLAYLKSHKNHFPHPPNVAVLPLRLGLSNTTAFTSFRFYVQFDVVRNKLIISPGNKFSALLLEGLYVPNIEHMGNEDQNTITAMYLLKLTQDLNRCIIINCEEVRN